MFAPATMSLIILFICIVLFVTETFTMATTAVLGCVLMVLFNVASFSTVFGQFSSSTVVLVVSMMVMGQAMFDNGATQFISQKLLKAAKGSERRLLTLSTLLACVISAFMSNVATVTLFIGLFSNLARDNGKIDVRNFMLPMGMASVVGGVSTLIGSAPQMTAQNYLINANYKGFRFFDFSYVGIFLIVLLVIYVTFIGYPLGKKIWANRSLSEAEEAPAAIPKVIIKKRMFATSAIFIITIILLFWEPVPMPVIAASGALITIMTGLVKPKDAIESVRWSSVLKVAGSLGILQAVNSSGGSSLMGQFFVKLVGGEISPYLLLLAVIFISQVLSEFMADSPAILIVLPVAISICVECGFNVYPYVMAIVLSSATACCCPLSNTPLMMVSAQGGYRFSDFVKYNLLWDILAEVVIFLTIPIFFPLV